MHQGKRFSDRRVDLDGQTFVDCTFERCTLVFSGGALPIFHKVTFDSCHWQLDGAARHTALFLVLLRDIGGSEVVDKFIEDLRKPPRSPARMRG